MTYYATCSCGDRDCPGCYDDFDDELQEEWEPDGDEYDDEPEPESWTHGIDA